MHPRTPHLHFFERKETQGKETPGSANSHINCIAQPKADKLGAAHLGQREAAESGTVKALSLAVLTRLAPPNKTISAWLLFR